MAILGDLEHRIMNVLWASNQALSVRAVHTQLLQERDLAYTTVMTVLDRLAKKGIVDRQLDGRAWLYVAARTQVDLVADEMFAQLMDCDGERAAALEAFAKRLPDDLRSGLA